MTQLAIRENLLPGRSIMQRFEAAKHAGLQGIEIMADNLDTHMMDYAEAMSATEIHIAALHMGRHSGYLSPDMTERESAISYLREMVAAAADLNIPQIVIVPTWRDSTPMPDLTPYRSSMALEAEMLIWLLRVVSDLVNAFDIKLCLQPVNHYETHFLQTQEQAVHFCREVNHPDIRIAPDTFHMALAEVDVLAALRTFGDYAEVLYLSDSNGRLPGRGLLDFAAIGEALQDLGYSGWLILNAHHPGMTPDDISQDLPAALQILQDAGVI